MNRVACPGCGHQLNFADERSGEFAECGKCGESFKLPQFAPAANLPTQGTTAATEPPGVVEATGPVRVVESIAAILIPLAAIYFFAGTLLGIAAARNTIQGDVQGDAAARDTGDTLAWFYQTAFEPANRPVRPFLPKEGRFQLFEIGNRIYYLDVAPIVAGIVVILALALGFGLVGTALQRKTKAS